MDQRTLQLGEHQQALGQAHHLLLAAAQVVVGRAFLHALACQSNQLRNVDPGRRPLVGLERRIAADLGTAANRLAVLALVLHQALDLVDLETATDRSHRVLGVNLIQEDTVGELLELGLVHCLQTLLDHEGNLVGGDVPGETRGEFSQYAMLLLR